MNDSIKSLINELGLSYKENSKSFIFKCPNCNKEKFYLHKIEGFFICFVCADSQNISGKSHERALAFLSNQPIAFIKSKLGFVEDKAPYFNDDEEVIEVIKVGPPEMYWPLDIYPIDHPKSERGLSYLNSRNISLEIALKYNLHYFPEQQRVIFPLEKEGRLYGWQARTVVDNPIKMLSSLNLPRNSMFMFQDRIKNSNHIILTEGPIDAIRADLCGGNIASMGKIITNDQLNILIKAPQKNIYFGLDPDAYLETERLVKKLYKHKDLFQIEISKKDLGEMDYEEVYEAFKRAKSVNPTTLYVHI